MHIVFKRGFILSEDGGKISSAEIRKSLWTDLIHSLDDFEPIMTTYSQQWKNWIAKLDIKTCLLCRRLHGKIFGPDDRYDEPPLHPHCRCVVEPLVAVVAGYATKNGIDGADYWLKCMDKLPEYYITRREAKSQGWIQWEGNLQDVAPDKMIGGDIYKNRNGHLPMAEGRIWYEADINYTGGFRTFHRVLYSNDGLVFVTYDHYETFWEVI